MHILKDHIFLCFMVQSDPDVPEIMGIMNLKPIFSLLFFEHRYLSCYLICQAEIFRVYSLGSSRGKCVSDYFFRSWFIFYDKKRVTFCHF